MELQCTEVVSPDEISSLRVFENQLFSMYQLHLKISDCIQDIAALESKLDKHSDCRIEIYHLVLGFVRICKGLLELLPYAYGMEKDLGELVCKLPVMMRISMMQGHVSVSKNLVDGVFLTMRCVLYDFGDVSKLMHDKIGLYHPDVRSEFLRLCAVLMDEGVKLLNCMTLTRPTSTRLGLLGQKIKFMEQINSGPCLQLGDLKTCIHIGNAFQVLQAQAERMMAVGGLEEGVVELAESSVRVVMLVVKSVCGGGGGGKSTKKLLGRIGAVEVELQDISWVLTSKEVDNKQPLSQLGGIFTEMERCLSEFGAAVTRHSFGSVKAMRILVHCIMLGMRVADVCVQALGLTLTKVSVDAVETLLDGVLGGLSSEQESFAPIFSSSSTPLFVPHSSSSSRYSGGVVVVGGGQFD